MTIEEKRKKNLSRLLQAFRRPSHYIQQRPVLQLDVSHTTGTCAALGGVHITEAGATPGGVVGAHYYDGNMTIW